MIRNRAFFIAAAVALLAGCRDAELLAPAAPGGQGASQAGMGWIVRPGATTPIEVSYEVRDGFAIWQGDIIIGRAGDVPPTRQALEARLARQGVRLGLALSASSSRWPAGEVPYEIDPGLASPQRVAAAIAKIESKTPWVKFIPRTSAHTDYVRIVPVTSGCASNLGRVGGQQQVLADASCSVGTLAHELLHTLGLDHEHVRCDRDSYLTINWSNMKDPAEPYYAKLCDGADEYGAYDYASIMHYYPYADAINTSTRTLTPNPYSSTNLSKMGQRDSLTLTDRNTVGSVYKPAAPVLSVAYPGNVPSLSWTATPGATGYNVYILREYSTQDYEFGNSYYEDMEYVGATTGTSFVDYGRSYTGAWMCAYGDGYTYRTEKMFYVVAATRSWWTAMPSSDRVIAYVFPIGGTC